MSEVVEQLPERAEPAQFRLYPRQRKRLAAIAKYLSDQWGQPVTPTDALRHLIHSFSLPEHSENRTSIVISNVNDGQ